MSQPPPGPQGRGPMGPHGPHGQGPTGPQGPHGPQGPGHQGPPPQGQGWNPHGVYGGNNQPIGQGGPGGPGRPGPQGGRPVIPPKQDGPVQPRKNRRLGLIIGGVAAALVLVLVGVLLFHNHQVKQEQARAAEAARKAEEERIADEKRQSDSATAAVKGYLDALAASDADKALAAAASKPQGEAQLLNRDVLLEANKRAQIGEIKVEQATVTRGSQGEWSTGTARTSYKIGDKQQQTELTLKKVGEEWKLDKVAAPVKLGMSGPERLVNAAKVQPGTYLLFPGSYSVTSTNPLVSLGNSDFVLGTPNDSSTSWEGEPTLSEEGKKQATDAARNAINACMRKKELTPPDCPFIAWRESNGIKINTSTLRYTLKNDPLAGVQWRFSAGTMAATATVTVTHEINASGTQNGRAGTLVPETSTRPAFLNAKFEGNGVTVTFS